MPSTYVYTSKARIGHDIQGGVETTKIDLQVAVMIRKTIVYCNNNFVNATSLTVIIRKWLHKVIDFDLRITIELKGDIDYPIKIHFLMSKQ